MMMIAEDFNKKMMMPSQSRDDLVSLHGEAKLLFNTYIRYRYHSYRHNNFSSIRRLLSAQWLLFYWAAAIGTVAPLLLGDCYRHNNFSSIRRLLSAQ